MIGFESFALIDRALGFSPQDSATSAETATAAIIVLWFPGRHGLFIKSGIGAAFGQFAFPTGPAQSDTSRGGGIGMTVGVGWDWAISRHVAITTACSAYVIGVGDVVLPTRRVDDVIATMYQGAIGLTFR
jgi:hypothetical protein